MRFKVKILYIFVFLCTILFNIKGVFALDINISDIKVTEKSDSITLGDTNHYNTDITSSIEFNELDDFVTYKVTLKNNDSKKYTIDSISDNNENDNIKVTYKYDDKTIKSKGNQNIYVTLKYTKKLVNKKKITLNDLTITLNLLDENGNKTSTEINPTTGDNIKIFVLLFIITLIVLLFSLLLIKRRKGKTLLLLFVLIPLGVLAKEKLSLNIKFTNITINGEMLPYTVSIKDADGNITDRTVLYGDEIGDLPTPRKDGYTFDKYVDDDNNEVTSETKVTGDITVTPKFNAINYTISYTLNGGVVLNPTSYTVEDEITLNNPTKLGYTFTGWTGTGIDTKTTSVTILSGSTGNREYVANWSANEDTEYTVTHRYQKLDGTYEEEVVTEYGETDKEVNAPIQSRTGFENPRAQQVLIKADGSSSVTYTYNREKYNFNITDRTYIDSTSTSNGEYLYETEITIKAVERVGYTFKWSDGETNYERTFELKDNKEITPIYTAKTNIPYKVVHQKQKITLDGYEIADTQNLTGTTDSSITPAVNTYTGFTSPETQTTTIKGDGTTVVTYTYNREKYNFNITDRTYIDSNSTTNGEYPYETEITIKAVERVGYTFKWSDNNTDYERTFNITKETSLTPIYTPNTNTTYKVIHKIMNLDGETYTVKETENLTGVTDTKVTPGVNSYEGFTSPEEQTVTIKGDGTTEVEYKYTRNKYTLTLQDTDYIKEDKSGE